mmetsp:Transcript_1288/g.3678  ORF Transcript_1288/g.3678 Transcript_1288/m.3678 type:complete len:212 (-) Transcript_1288:88-723(-)
MRASHARSVPSAPPEKRRWDPAFPHATLRGALVWPCMVLTARPMRRSTILTVLSLRAAAADAGGPLVSAPARTVERSSTGITHFPGELASQTFKHLSPPETKRRSSSDSQAATSTRPRWPKSHLLALPLTSATASVARHGCTIARAGSASARTSNKQRPPLLPPLRIMLPRRRSTAILEMPSAWGSQLCAKDTSSRACQWFSSSISAFMGK